MSVVVPRAPAESLPRLSAAQGAWVVAALALLGFAYRIWWIPHSGITLFVDEAYYWDWSRTPAFGYYSKPPVIAWLIAASTALFGDGVLGVKLLTMALYPLTGWVLYRLGCELFDEAAGRWAAVLFLCAPMTGLLGMFVTTDAPLLLCWALAALSLWRALTRPGLGWWCATGAAVGIGLLSKYTMAAFVPGALLVWWFVPPRGGRSHRVAGPLLAAAIATALFAPNLLWNLEAGWPTLRHTAEITVASGARGGIAALLEFTAGQALMLGPIAFGLWLAASMRARAQPNPGDEEQRGAANAFVAAMTWPLLLIGAVQAWRAHANLNWAAPAWLGACLWIGAAWTRPPQASRWLFAAASTALLLSALVLHLDGIATLAGRELPARLDAFARMRGWDRAFDALRPVLAAHAGAVVLGENRTVLAHAAYHTRALGLRLRAWNPEGRIDDHYRLTTRLDPGQGRALLISERADPQDVLSRFERATPLATATADIGPGRVITLHVYLLQNFKGYR